MGKLFKLKKKKKLKIGRLFKFKKKNKKNGRNAIILGSVIASILMIIVIGTALEDKNISTQEDSIVISDENIPIEEITNDSIDNNEINKEQIQTDAIDDTSDIGTDNLGQSKEENKIDLEKLKLEELAKIVMYSGTPYCIINSNIPFFNNTDLVTTSYEKYSNLDILGRCGVTIACIGKDIMPTEERGNIGSIKPSGWHTVKYNGIDGNYLYNRCHLIGFQLTAENANERNLITGTRYMNVQGMLPFENMVADYIKETNNHVLYRVTPIFKDNNLLASGVLMEAKSVEDDGSGIEFCVYCYNVQPGITINYKTGESSGPEYTGTTTQNHESNTTTIIPSITENNSSSNIISAKYVLNTNSKKVHFPTCSSVKEINEKNKSSYNGEIEELTNQGYTPCGICKPYTIEKPKVNTVPNVNTDKKEASYILNTNTKVFHYPFCRSVKQMSEKNKKEFYGTSSEARNLGYKSCGNCKP